MARNVTAACAINAYQGHMRPIERLAGIVMPRGTRDGSECPRQHSRRFTIAKNGPIEIPLNRIVNRTRSGWPRPAREERGRIISTANFPWISTIAQHCCDLSIFAEVVPFHGARLGAILADSEMHLVPRVPLYATISYTFSVECKSVVAAARYSF